MAYLSRQDFAVYRWQVIEMKYPKLVRHAEIDVHITVLSDDINEFNERETILDADFKCNYQSTGMTKTSDKSTSPEVTGCIFINGDIIPKYEDVTNGYAVIFAKKHEISGIQKARNPDGTVNYVRIDIK